MTNLVSSPSDGLVAIIMEALRKGNAEGIPAASMYAALVPAVFPSCMWKHATEEAWAAMCDYIAALASK